MKKLTIFLTVMVLTAMSAGAFAQVETWWENSIGIYCADGQPCTSLPINTADACYLTLRQPTNANGVLGWEAAISVDGPGFIAGVVFQGTNFINYPAYNYAVGCGTPLPFASEIVLAEITYLVTDITAPMNFYLSPLEDPSIPNAMAFADGADPDVLIEMYVTAPSFDDPVFVVNGPCPVGTEETNWGEVKALFR